MGLIGFTQRRNISKNTKRAADILAEQYALQAGGLSYAERQAAHIAERDARIRAAQDVPIAKRCRKSGMTEPEIAAFLALSVPERRQWATDHPDIKTGYHVPRS